MASKTRILGMVSEREVLATFVCTPVQYRMQAGILAASGFIYWKKGIYVDPKVYASVRRRGWKPLSTFHYESNASESRLVTAVA